MPTFTFELPIADVRFHRRVAKELSFWLTARGVDINHVMTKFAVLDHAYSGPFPLDDRFAFAHCVVARERGPRFRVELAACITTTLQPEIPPERVFIRFDQIDRAQHWTGTQALEQGGPDDRR